MISGAGVVAVDAAALPDVAAVTARRLLAEVAAIRGTTVARGMIPGVGSTRFQGSPIPIGRAPVPSGLQTGGRAFGWAYTFIAGVVLLFAVGVALTPFLRAPPGPTAGDRG